MKTALSLFLTLLTLFADAAHADVAAKPAKHLKAPPPLKVHRASKHGMRHQMLGVSLGAKPLPAGGPYEVHTPITFPTTLTPNPSIRLNAGSPILFDTFGMTSISGDNVTGDITVDAGLVVVGEANFLDCSAYTGGGTLCGDGSGGITYNGAALPNGGPASFTFIDAGAEYVAGFCAVDGGAAIGNGAGLISYGGLSPGVVPAIYNDGFGNIFIEGGGGQGVSFGFSGIGNQNFLACNYAGSGVCSTLETWQMQVVQATSLAAAGFPVAPVAYWDGGSAAALNLYTAMGWVSTLGAASEFFHDGGTGGGVVFASTPGCQCSCNVGATAAQVKCIGTTQAVTVSDQVAGCTTAFYSCTGPH